MKVTKQHLINQVHANSDINKKTIVCIVQDFLEVLHGEIVAGNEVRINELGTFKITTRKAHVGYNPNTREVIEIPEKRTLHLKVSSAVKRDLNNVE